MNLPEKVLTEWTGLKGKILNRVSAILEGKDVLITRTEVELIFEECKTNYEEQFKERLVKFLYNPHEQEAKELLREVMQLDYLTDELVKKFKEYLDE